MHFLPTLTSHNTNQKVNKNVPIEKGAKILVKSGLLPNLPQPATSPTPPPFIFICHDDGVPWLVIPADVLSFNMSARLLQPTPRLEKLL